MRIVNFFLSLSRRMKILKKYIIVNIFKLLYLAQYADIYQIPFKIFDTLVIKVWSKKKVHHPLESANLLDIFLFFPIREREKEN